MRKSSMVRRAKQAITFTACALFLLQTVDGVAQIASGSIDAEWHVATCSGRVTIERVNRSSVEVAESRDAPIWIGEKVITRETGKAGIDGPEKLGIRIREQTKLRRADASAWEVESGLAGFRFEQTASDTPLNLILSPWAKVEFRSGIVIVKVAPYLTRVAVLKGTADVTGQGGVTRTLGPKQECAAVPSAISSVYEATDDLYFAWYWDKP